MATGLVLCSTCSAMSVHKSQQGSVSNDVVRHLSRALTVLEYVSVVLCMSTYSVLLPQPLQSAKAMLLVTMHP